MIDARQNSGDATVAQGTIVGKGQERTRTTTITNEDGSIRHQEKTFLGSDGVVFSKWVDARG